MPLAAPLLPTFTPSIVTSPQAVVWAQAEAASKPLQKRAFSAVFLSKPGG